MSWSGFGPSDCVRLHFRGGSSVHVDARVIRVCLPQKGNVSRHLPGSFDSVPTSPPCTPPPHCSGPCRILQRVRPVLFLLSSAIGVSALPPGMSFIFLCYELTVWILEVVILIDQTSSRELSASPDSVESEIVPTLEKFLTEKGERGGRGEPGGESCRSLPSHSPIYP